jgi:hypothetical protein
MNAWTDADVERVGRALEARTLPKAEWTHAAHFAAAFWLLSDPARDAFGRMPGLIRAYNESTGVANTDSGGYHETITQASLRAARAWLDQHPGTALAVMLERFLATPYGRSDWLLMHWSRERLFSVEARRAWREPDLAPLPF